MACKLSGLLAGNHGVPMSDQMSFTREAINLVVQWYIIYAQIQVMAWIITSDRKRQQPVSISSISLSAHVSTIRGSKLLPYCPGKNLHVFSSPNPRLCVEPQNQSGFRSSSNQQNLLPLRKRQGATIDEMWVRVFWFNQKQS